MSHCSILKLAACCSGSRHLTWECSLVPRLPITSVCVSIAGLSGRDLFFTKCHQSSLNSESYYNTAKGFVPGLKFPFFRVFWESPECGSKQDVNGKTKNTFGNSVQEACAAVLWVLVFLNLLHCPQLSMGWQEACMDWSVLGLDSAKTDLLAKSKYQQAVFLSLEWNWPKGKKITRVLMVTQLMFLLCGDVLAPAHVWGWPFNPCRVSGRTRRGGCGGTLETPPEISQLWNRALQHCQFCSE